MAQTEREAQFNGEAAALVFRREKTKLESRGNFIKKEIFEKFLRASRSNL